MLTSLKARADVKQNLLTVGTVVDVYLLTFEV